MTILQPGQKLGPYQIIEQIGKGGMASVYKAYHPSMDRYVALKVVATEMVDDPNFIQRFKQEARLIAKLEHPHILPVHDFGEADGIPYLVMRYLEAGTLKERLAAAQLSLAEIDRIFTQLADALEYAHENGIIHRDIKPSNAMLDKRGDIFLTDFGVAKMMESASHITATGTITGTPAYMSPEQAQGIKTDRRTDIYSLGIVLYEMLTGHVPFEAETPMAVIFKQIQEPPPPLSLVRPDLPSAFELLLLKALTKNPNDRFASMADFRQAWKNTLTTFSTLPPGTIHAATPPAPVSETPIPAEASAPIRRPIDWKRITIGLAVLCAVILLGAGAYFWPRLRNRIFANRPRATAEATATQQAPAPTDFTSTSWAGANSVYSIAILGEKLYTGGAGGVTIWNRSDGASSQITTADGLSDSWAPLVYADPLDESLWVGTANGLIHFNGQAWKTYKSGDGLDSDYVTAVTRWGDRIVAGTKYCSVDGCGLQIFDGTKWQAVKGFPSSQNEQAGAVSYNINAFETDSNNGLWIATDYGLVFWDGGDQWQIFDTNTGLPSNAVYSLLIDSNGDVWAGTNDGGLARFNPGTRMFDPIMDLREQGIYDVHAMLQDRNGLYWFVGSSVVSYDAVTGDVTLHSPDTDGFPESSVVSVAQDQDGILYFGTEGSGLVRMADGNASVWMIPNRPRFAAYGPIIPAPDGKIYFIELYQNGVDQFDPAQEAWIIPPDGISIPRAIDPQGRLWSGSYDGIWLIAPNKLTHITMENGLPSGTITAVAFAVDGTAYIGTDAGIAVFDGTAITDTYTVESVGLFSNEILTLYAASDGSLWVASGNGFSRRAPDGKWEHVAASDLFGGYVERITDFVEDSNGMMWASTWGDGVYRLTESGWQRTLSTDLGSGLTGDYVNSVTLAPDGSLWFGVSYGGAVRFDGQTWSSFGLDSGLIDLTVNDIYIDPNGELWFTTSGGITHWKARQ